MARDYRDDSVIAWNTTDKYKKTAMKIKKFKYNIIEEIGIRGDEPDDRK